jgi:dTDP-4-amino-4,6-dideoxygalactose transaminase
MATAAQIPLVDLKAQYRGLQGAMQARIAEVIESGEFIQGRYVAEFEKAFVTQHGASFGCGCSSGTSALFLALTAAGVGPGDEVITTPNTFIATAEAIVHAGARPVFVDVEPTTAALDPAKIEAAITPRTRAIVPVHIYGNPCDMDAIGRIVTKHKLLLVEDCAQAHFATYRGRPVGTFGEAAAFSFYPGKNLGAYGDAGFVFTRTEAALTTVRKLLDHGRLSKYEHDRIGYNHRIDGLQAAILSVKLPHMEAWTAARRRLAKLYDEALSGAGIQTIQGTPGANPVHHLYVVQVSNRAAVMDHLKTKGIATGVHYPVPLHLQPALASQGWKRGDFPASEALASRVLSLPVYPELTEDQVLRISSELKGIAAP